MRKENMKGILTVIMTGAVMWAFIFAAVGGSGRPVSGSDSEKDETVATSSDICNWGLSFQKEGSSPVGNAAPSYLKQYDAYYIDEDGIDDKNIYLTFDAGYENGYTEDILDVLKEEEVPAAFFVVGNYIQQNPDIVKRMEEEGHTVGNHTMHHPDMASIADKEDFRAELEQLEQLYEDATGKEMKKVYRPPQGKYSEENLKQAREMGYTTIFWSLAYVDWYEDDQPTREEALNKLNSRIHPGAIVLLHSTSKTNSKILKELIEGWKKEGYNFCSIDNIM